jgi:membrane protein implicated in regulation of membrane protease activity
MSRPLAVQFLAAGTFLAVVVVAAILIGHTWAQYVVFGVFFLALIGAAVAVNKRNYPTKKRGITRDPDSRW